MYYWRASLPRTGEIIEYGMGKRSGREALNSALRILRYSREFDPMDETYEVEVWKVPEEIEELAPSGGHDKGNMRFTFGDLVGNFRATRRELLVGGKL